MNRKTIEMKIDVEVNVVEEFCSIPIEHDVESYAQELCDKWKEKQPNTNFTYYIDYDLIDEMSGETIGYIYEDGKKKIKLIEQLKRNAKYEFFNDYLNMIEVGDDMVLREMWQNVNKIEECKTIKELKEIEFVDKEVKDTWESWDAIYDHQQGNLFEQEVAE